MEIIIENIAFWGENELNKGGIEITWSADIGFGTFQYYLDENMNFILADDETLGLEFGKEVLHKALKLKESE